MNDSNNLVFTPIVCKSGVRAPGSYSNRPGSYSNRPAPPAPKENVFSFTQLELLQKEWVQSKNLEICRRSLSDLFCSIFDILLAFKLPCANEVEVNEELLRLTYSFISELPVEVHRAVLVSVNKCLNALPRGSTARYNTDHLRVYFILLQNPLLYETLGYHILARLLSQLSFLSDTAHRTFVYWLERIPKELYRSLVAALQDFITRITYFSSVWNRLPPPERRKYWVPAAVKTLALFNAANDQTEHIANLYNYTLDGLDVIQQYLMWLANDSDFTFCQYPFILSLQSKHRIIRYGCEKQMKKIAKRCVVRRMQERQFISSQSVYLSINVRRDMLVNDSIIQLEQKEGQLNKKVKVQFIGEPAIDMGGLTKEWFLLATNAIFHQKYGLFDWSGENQQYWFSTGAGNYGNHGASSGAQFHNEYKLVGILMGLAVYNNITLDLKLPPLIYSKLLATPPAANTGNHGNMFNKPLTTSPTLLMCRNFPDIWRSLQELLSYVGNVEEDFGLYFCVQIDCFGKKRVLELKEGGSLLPVKRSNRAEYVDLYCNYYINTSVEQQFYALYKGFYSVSYSIANTLMLLTGPELQEIVCGVEKVDLKVIRAFTAYDGFQDGQHLTIRLFWELVHEMSMSDVRKLLMFWTGSSRVPVHGNLHLTLSESPLRNRLLEAHTCFNQLIMCPEQDKAQLYKYLHFAIDNCEGFGLE